MRLYLSWDGPDRFESNFTEQGFRAFCAYIQPLLDGSGAAGLPEALAVAEVERAERALELPEFEWALAIRCLTAALTAGHGHDSVALAALAGRDVSPSAEGR